MSSIKDQAARTKLQYLERVIAQAFKEGASAESIDAHLVEQGVAEPELWRSRVEVRKVNRLLGAIELDKLGGRNAFRKMFQLSPLDTPTPVEEVIPLTESGDAEFFRDMFQDRVRYNHRTAKWLISDDVTGLWLPDRTEQMLSLACAAMRKRQERALEVTDPKRKQIVSDWAIKGENLARLNHLLTIAQALEPIADDGEHWDEDPSLLGCGNGVIDLRTAAVRRALPKERITMRVRVPFIPDAPCALWDRTIAAVFAPPPSMDSLPSPSDMLDTPDASKYTPEMVAFLQRALGYSITGDCREECCFFAWGEGSNGKGTIMNTVGWLMADYNDDMLYSTLEKTAHGGGIPSDVAKLAGKRFVTSTEVNEFHINESRLKALTGRDPMTARFLYQNEFTFIPVCKIWIATNHKPKIMGQDDGIWRRIYLIPFVNHFAGATKDDTLKDKLRTEQELTGILRWLVEGAKEWYAKGLMPPATVIAATAEYREESDPLTPFFEQRCVFGAKYSVVATAIWQEYLNFCSNNAVDELWRLGQKRFYSHLKKKFGSREARNDARARILHFTGIGLRDGHRQVETAY